MPKIVDQTTITAEDIVRWARSSSSADFVVEGNKDRGFLIRSRDRMYTPPNIFDYMFHYDDGEDESSLKRKRDNLNRHRSYVSDIYSSIYSMFFSAVDIEHSRIGLQIVFRRTGGGYVVMTSNDRGVLIRDLANLPPKKNRIPVDVGKFPDEEIEELGETKLGPDGITVADDWSTGGGKGKARSMGFDVGKEWWHGTNSNYRQYSHDFLGQTNKKAGACNALRRGPGIYMAEDQVVARTYIPPGAGGYLFKLVTSAKNAFDCTREHDAWSSSSWGGQPITKDAFTGQTIGERKAEQMAETIQNLAAHPGLRTGGELYDAIGRTGINRCWINTYLMAMGYDSIYHVGDFDSEVLVVFDPKKVKCVEAKFVGHHDFFD